SDRRIATPAVTLSCGSSRFSSRPTRSEAHCPEEGITCITPTALAGETAAGLNPDSCCAIASASAGSTPMRWAVWRIMARIWSRLGRFAESNGRLLAFAPAVAAAEEVECRNVAATGRPGMVSSCPTRMTPEEPRPLASMMAEVDVPYLAARPETVSPVATVCCTDSEDSEDFEDVCPPLEELEPPELLELDPLPGI